MLQLGLEVVEICSFWSTVPTLARKQPRMLMLGHFGKNFDATSDIAKTSR